MESRGEEEEGLKNLVPVTGSKIAEPEVLGDREANAEMIRKRVIELRDAVADSYFELGRHLYFVQKEALYSMWGYESFSDYIDQEVTFAWRKAMYLMRIYRYFALELGNKQVFDKVRELGWNKAAALVEVVDSKNVDDWVSKAKDLPVKKLEDEARFAKKRKAEIKRNKADAADARDAVESEESEADSKARSGNAANTSDSGVHASEHSGADPVPEEERGVYRHNFTMLVADDQKENIDLAMRLAHELINENVGKQDKDKNQDAKGYLLDYVATAFIATHNGTVRESKIKHRANFRHELLQSMERSMGIVLVALDKKTKDVVYGQDTVNRFEDSSDEVS